MLINTSCTIAPTYPSQHTHTHCSIHSGCGLWDEVWCVKQCPNIALLVIILFCLSLPWLTHHALSGQSAYQSAPSGKNKSTLFFNIYFCFAIYLNVHFYLRDSRLHCAKIATLYSKPEIEDSINTTGRIVPMDSENAFSINKLAANNNILFSEEFMSIVLGLCGFPSLLAHFVVSRGRGLGFFLLNRKRNTYSYVTCETK